MSETFQITGIELASYLVSAGFDFPEMSIHDGRVTFRFDDPDGSVAWSAEAYRLATNSDGEELMIPVRRLWAAHGRLKSKVNALRWDEKKAKKGEVCEQ
jgi:hypothetical protein